MSPMHQYLYYTSNIILSKNDVFTVFNANVSLSTKRQNVRSLVTVTRSSAFAWHNIFL